MKGGEGGPGLAAIGDEELEAVQDVLRTRRLSRYSEDDHVPSWTYRFECEMAASLGVGHCLALNSCSAAQLVGFWSLDLEPGDEVLVPGFGFSSCYSSVALAGGVPVLDEVDESLGMDARDMAAKITSRTRAVMVVHMLGRPSDLNAIAFEADRQAIHLVEDAAQALGAQSCGVAVGSFGRFATFSFNPFKVLTAGDGGLLATSDTRLYERAFALHDHGARPLRGGVAGTGPFMGLNLRMNELASAVAYQQLQRLPAILGRTRSVASDLAANLDLPDGVRLQSVSPSDADTGSAVVLTFADCDQAMRFAEMAGTHTLAGSGKHYYGALRQLQTWAFPRTVERPTDELLSKYRPGSLPKTDDILRRTVALGVGVHDTYLGTGCGVDLDADSDQRIAFAGSISSLLHQSSERR